MKYLVRGLAVLLVLSIFILALPVGADEKINDPVDPATIAKSELFPNVWLYPFEGKIWRLDWKNNQTNIETGEDQWLPNVYVTKVYFINHYYLAIEGQFDDEIHGAQPWLMLSALDEDGHVGFGRYITANAFNATYVDPKQIGFVNAQGQNCIENIHGDLFWPPATCS